jgi:hypothetical protein
MGIYYSYPSKGAAYKANRTGLLRNKPDSLKVSIILAKTMLTLHPCAGQFDYF